MSGRDEIEAMADFVDELGVGAFPHLADLDGSIWSGYGVTGQPAWILVDDDGTSELRFGALGADGIAEAAEGLLAS